MTAEERDLKLHGERLSNKYCTECHLNAAPELLTRASWLDVLYKMREELGKSSMPINEMEWDTLQSYYATFSTDLLPIPERTIRTQAKLFEKNDSVFNLLSTGSVSITLLKYDGVDGSVFFGDIRKQLYHLRNNQAPDTFSIGNVPVSMIADKDRQVIHVLCIGSVAPSEKANGQLLEIDLHSKKVSVLIDSLKRPVHFEETDIDDDGDPEFLVTSFGSTVGAVNSGRLSVFKKDKDHYREQVLMESPGATKVIVDDYNQDGRPDVFALFSQGAERILRFTNEGNLKFSTSTLLEFPPVYGTSDFTLQDMDNDGRKDIVVVNGDNGDYSPVYKPYHGLRIYKDQGDQKFSQSYFLAINGAMRFVVQDFDLDKDPDIIVLSIYPNMFFTPEETLVYLENDKGEFSPSFLEKTPSGKWMIMDVGDVDHDGYPDVITGANNMLTFPMPDEYVQSFHAVKKMVAVFSNIHRD